MLRDQLRVVQGDKGLVCILYVHKRNECIVPTLVLFQSISGPRDETERERVGACVIPKADSKF